MMETDVSLSPKTVSSSSHMILRLTESQICLWTHLPLLLRRQKEEHSEMMSLLIINGADGIMTNMPSLLKSVYEEYEQN